MNSRVRTWLLALALVLGLSLSLVHGAAAAGGNLPTFKAAPSENFSLTGSITVGPSVRNLAGSGTQGGNLFQQTLNVSPAQGVGLVSVQMIQVGDAFYFKFMSDPQWQSIDLSKLPGGVPNIQSNIPGLNGFTPNGGLRTYEAVQPGSVEQVGPATIEGAATTEYQGSVDLAKLYTSIGTPAAQAAQIAAVSKMTLTLWIGDADQFVHQQRVVLNSKAAGPGGALLDVMVDFTITYRDFGTQLAISAPAQSVPYVPAPPAPPPVSPGGNPTPTPPNLGLPTIKAPTSSRFDLHGTIAAGDQTVTISGSGSQSGQAAQLDMTLSTPSEPTPVTIHIITVDMKLYLRVGDSEQWQVEDLSQMGSSGGMIPGMGGMPGMMPGMIPGMGGDLNSLLQLLSDSIHTTKVGPEKINGAATTKYQVDIDVAKLVNGVGSSSPPTPQEQQILASAKFQILLWVGDADQYLHQLQMLLSAAVPDAQNQPQAVSVDFTITFRDFDAPITITAPANAVPIDQTGLPGGIGGAIPVISPPNPAPGMPRTGAPAGLPLPLLALLAAGLVCAGLGVRLRMRNT